jgi:transposase
MFINSTEKSRNSKMINNGILEGLNSPIQAAKAKARGYRTFENFSAIIYLIPGKLDFSKTGLPT